MGKLVNVGLIGCGEVAQVIHIPTLNNMSDYYRITYLCDVSAEALEHCRQKVNHFSTPKTTRSAEELCSSSDVDVVFVINSTEYHVQHALLALKHDKIAFVEKPLAMNERDHKLLADAERASKGTVMVGYMRRYAAAFKDAVNEIGGMDQIKYATVRDIIGKNALFVGQSGLFPKYYSDYSKQDSDDKKRVGDDMAEQGLANELGVKVSAEKALMWTMLGNLGSHDLSVMREALGMPEKVLGCSLSMKNMFWSVLFQYPNFAVTYESGIHNVPLFDSHLEVFSDKKQVKIRYDTPYIKGVPITMTVREDLDGSGALSERVIRRTYEDPYTLEMRQLWALATEGTGVKTTVADAGEDLKIFQMVMKAGEAQLAS